jgi:hypothetical protein
MKSTNKQVQKDLKRTEINRLPKARTKKNNRRWKQSKQDNRVRGYTE